MLNWSIAQTRPRPSTEHNDACLCVFGKIALLTTVLHSAQGAEAAHFIGFELGMRHCRRGAWLSGCRSDEGWGIANSMPAFPEKLWTRVEDSGSVRWSSDLLRSAAFCWQVR